MVNRYGRDRKYYLKKFHTMYTKRYVNDSTTQCWIWARGTNKKGYGHFSAFGKRCMAHRWIWEMTNGPIPKGKIIMHLCDNPSCVNPAHLRVGDHKENMQDRNAKGRQAKGERSGVHTQPHTRCYGERCGKAKLTWEIVDKIRARAKEVSNRVVAQEFGISPGQANKIINLVQWKDEGRPA